GSYVMMPAAGLTDCLLLPPPFARSFLTALCNSPAPATEPNHQRPSATHRRIAAVVPRDRMLAEGPLPHQPHRFVRLPLLAHRHLALGTLLDLGPVGPCRHVPPWPQAVMAAWGHGRKRHRGLGRLGDDPGGASRSRLLVALGRQDRTLP